MKKAAERLLFVFGIYRFLKKLYKKRSLFEKSGNQEKGMLSIFRRFSTADTRLCRAEWRWQSHGIKESFTAKTSKWWNIEKNNIPFIFCFGTQRFFAKSTLKAVKIGGGGFFCGKLRGYYCKAGENVVSCS